MEEHTCKECGNSYNKKWRLEEHIRSHTGEVNAFSIYYTGFVYFGRSESKKSRAKLLVTWVLYCTFWFVTECPRYFSEG